MNNTLAWIAAAVVAYLTVDFAINYIARAFFWKWWYRNYYLKSLHWRITRWRKKTQMWYSRGAVFCERCGSRKRLHVHHVTYERLGWERMSDLQIICHKCHRPGSGVIT